MKTVFLLSIRQLARKRRFLFILLLGILPVVLAAIVSALADMDKSQDPEFINNMLDGMIIAAIMPLVTIALSTRVFGDELEDRTLSYLVLKPLPRWKIVLPKVLSAIVLCAPLMVISGVITTLIWPSGSGHTALAVGAALLAGVMTYATIFTWAGLVSTHALGFGLVYVLLWEGVVSSLLSSVRYLSVRGYTLAIMHGLDDSSFESIQDRVIEFPAGVAGAIVVTVIFFYLTIRRLRRMDVP